MPSEPEHELRLMAVHAHPDDESSKGAATTAYYAANGVRVLVVSCTGGERGDVLNPRLQQAAAVTRDIAEYRRGEMARAAQILGVEHRWLGFVDSGLPDSELGEELPEGCFALTPLFTASRALIHLVRQFRPHVMTTYDENGGYPHPDHIMCHKISMEAFEYADNLDRYPGPLPPWQPLKMYYNTFAMDRLTTLHEAMLNAGLDSPYGQWIERRSAMQPRTVTTQVRCSDYFQQRDDALRAHATQIDPDGWFFSVPRELEVAHWPYEDFELAQSRIPTTPIENDLFAGVLDHLSQGK